MCRAVVVSVAALVTALIAAAPASAIIVGGGGAPSKDCLVTFDAPVNFPITGPNQVRCVDGDTDCDKDGGKGPKNVSRGGESMMNVHGERWFVSLDVLR